MSVFKTLILEGQPDSSYKDELNSFIKTDTEFSKLFENKDFFTPLINDLSVLQSFINFQSILDKFCPIKINALFLTISIYYIILIESELNVNIESILTDLALLSKIDGLKSTAMAAYLIGHKLTDSQVNAMLSVRQPGYFPINFPELPFSLDLANYWPSEDSLKAALATDDQFSEMAQSEEDAQGKKEPVSELARAELMADEPKSSPTSVEGDGLEPKSSPEINKLVTKLETIAAHESDSLTLWVLTPNRKRLK
ncbi:MAG: hypothetical protein LBT38_01780 [Deltaproteobacteria bacterium]|nr:hypothetical protein [Deltaproteobacteria bacterium]